MKFRLEVVYAENVDEWLDYIKNSELLISGCFHHSIAAYALNIPYITYASHSPKTSVPYDIKNHKDIISLCKRNFLPFLKNNISSDS